jgi:predicted dehydrogenase
MIVTLDIMGQLLRAVTGGTEPEISGRDNPRTMALVDAAYRAIATGRSASLRESNATE